jgi:hypothetical protein
MCRAMNDELRVHRQTLEKRLAGNVMLVMSKRSATERQRVAFEATEQERSAREPTHVVGTQDDARQAPDCIGDTRFEREDLPLGGPAGTLPPEVPEDSDHRYSVTDGRADPELDLSQQAVGGLLTGHDVNAITLPCMIEWQPAAFEARQDARVGGIVSEQDAHFVALQARGEKSRRRVEILIILPEVADVVSRRRECVGDTQRDAALERPSMVKAPGSEEAEESGFLGTVGLSLASPELPERTHHELDLRQVLATSGACPHVFVAACTLGRG